MPPWLHDLLTITAPVLISFAAAQLHQVRKIDRLGWEQRQARKDLVLQARQIAAMRSSLDRHERSTTAHRS